MRNVVLLSGHIYDSRKKAGFHFLCDALRRKGYRVTFVTTSRCTLSDWLKNSRLDRSRYPVNQVVQVSDGFFIYIVHSFLYPVDLRSSLLNHLFVAAFKKYERLSLRGLEKVAREADLFIFESCLGLFFAPRLRLLNRTARIIYRVSDDLRLLNYTPLLQDYEKQILAWADLISVPCQPIYDKFAGLAKVVLQPHGIDKDLFDRAQANPYATPPFSTAKNLIFVGMSHLDDNFLRIAADLFPQYYFHIIGPFQSHKKQANLIFYGVRRFEETISYIKYADAGLQIRTFVPFAETLSDSLKYQQYTYCQLPIIAPDYMRSNKPHVFYYKDNDASSIKSSVESALRFDRNAIPRHKVQSWDEIVDSMIASVSPHEL